jgi:hypothetical protein
MSEDINNQTEGSFEKKQRPTTWEDVFFGAIQKIAAAPSKIKDPKDAVSSTIGWMNSTRQDIQEKFVGDLADKVSKVNWEMISKQVGEHLANKYDIEITSRVSLKPKARNSSDEVIESEEIKTFVNQPSSD